MFSARHGLREQHREADALACELREDAKLRNYSVRFFRNNATPMTVRVPWTDH